MKKAYLTPLTKLIQTYKTDIDEGLTNQQADELLKEYGLNTLPEKNKESYITIFFKQLKDPIIYILLITAFIAYFVVNKTVDAGIILAVVLFNSIIGAIQEGKAQNIIESLKHFLSPTCLVIRDGKQQIIDTEHVVPGDIIVVQGGDQIPADARLIKSQGLKITEALLTGESTPVEKDIRELDEEVAIHDQANMLFKGTHVVSGNGIALVIGTGEHTEIGRIHTSIETVTTEMPLKEQLSYLSKWIVGLVLIQCVFVFIVGIATGKTFADLFYLLTALFVSSIPAGLPVVLTIVLARGAYRMAQQNMLVTKLQAAEGLGRTEVIIIDKTGTLTHNEMSVFNVFTSDGHTYSVTGQGYKPRGDVYLDKDKVTDFSQHNKLDLLKDASVLLDQSVVKFKKDVQKYQVKGEPLEAAMGVFAQKLTDDINRLKENYTELHDIPFNPDTLMHIGWYEKDGTIYVYAVGAPEAILNASSDSEKDKQAYQKALTSFLHDGLRTLGLAYKTFDRKEFDTSIDFEAYTKEHIIGSMNFLAFFGIQDSIRSDVKHMIEKARYAGMTVIMATGDHKKTAEFVAQKTGIITDDKPHIITGTELNKMSETELLKALETVNAFARVTPQEKIKIVTTLQNQGKRVAMTGDGVNDAPALVGADLGIAMGISGTEVAQKAADLVLLDDSFGSIVHGVEEGRHIFYTIRRLILYLLATNVGEVMIISASVFLGLALPLLPTHILWLNIVTDGLLDIALAMEPKEDDLLDKSWLEHIKQMNIIDRYIVYLVFFLATPMMIGSLILFTSYDHIDIDTARTMTMTVMAAFQWFNAWNCRSITLSVFTKGLFTNMWLVLTTIFVIILQLGMIYLPFMQNFFHTKPITLYEWAIIILTASSVLILNEIVKYIYRNYFISEQ
jgi:Ca2+-transporting ATPase